MELPIVYLRYIILQLMFALLRHVIDSQTSQDTSTMLFETAGLRHDFIISLFSKPEYLF